MEDRTLKQLLMSSSYFVLNKQIVKAIGIEAGFLLTTLIEASDGLANEDGWFYKTSPSLEEETGLSNHKQSKIIEELTKLGILDQENKGMPMKRYFRINFQKIEKLVFKKDSKNLKSSIEENEKQGFKNFESKDLKNSNACIEKISNNKELNNNNLNKELNNIYKEAVDYLNKKAGTKYKSSSKNTTKHIKARINDGYTLEDFKTVIDKKCSEWLNTDMEKYLCPDTLFGSKFEKYLNQKINGPGVNKNTQNNASQDIKWGD
jgi:hypothetical protein|nr:MAG TPA: hypothetical protein [Caudoviricetes sp.]